MNVERLPYAGGGAAGERQDAITMRPNPAREELHVTWLRDMHRQPSRRAVFDVVETDVSADAIDDRRGTTLWNCIAVCIGGDNLRIHDASENAIASAHIIKQEP
jgi:hypothetical protein